MSVGRRIHQLRSESHITQRELGEATGLAVSYLSRVENGKQVVVYPDGGINHTDHRAAGLAATQGLRVPGQSDCRSEVL